MADRDPVATALIALYPRLHEKLVASCDGLSDDEVRLRRPHANSIAFNLWHVARWDDTLAAHLARRAAVAARGASPEQVWARGEWAGRWGMPTAKLGSADAGTGLSDDEAADLRLPGGAELQGYAREAFVAFDRVLAGLTEADWSEPLMPDKPRTVADAVTYYYEHAARHLGMIEALKGTLGKVGSAGG